MAGTGPEIYSKMDSEVYALNNNFERYNNELNTLLITLIHKINNDPIIKLNKSNTMYLKNINPPEVINIELPNIIILGGSAFTLMSEYLHSNFNTEELKKYAPRTNDFDIAICVDDVRNEESQKRLIEIATEEIHNYNLENMEGLLDFDENTEIPSREVLIGVYKNNKIQLTQIKNKNYFTVRININVPVKGTTHLFELVFWNTKDKEECNFEGKFFIKSNIGTEFNGVIVPSIPELIENTTRVIFRRGMFNIGKCRQDYLRLRWLYEKCLLQIHKHFNESLFKDNAQIKK